MPDLPDAKALLEAARETLAALLPETEARHHYALRMVGNAMAIAAREIAAPVATGDGAALLARTIACPIDDRAAQRTLHAALVAATRERLAISQPRALR